MMTNFIIFSLCWLGIGFGIYGITWVFKDQVLSDLKIHIVSSPDVNDSRGYVAEKYQGRWFVQTVSNRQIEEHKQEVIKKIKGANNGK